VLLAVTGEDLLARSADLGAIALQTAQDPEHVIRIDLKLQLAILDHIRMTGSAFLIVSLTHWRGYGRRLRRHLGARGWSCGKRERDRRDRKQERYADHDFLSGHSARPLDKNNYPTFSRRLAVSTATSRTD